MGIHYLKTVRKSGLGNGLMGISKSFDGLGVYLNSIISYPNESGSDTNIIQVYFNKNDQQINHYAESQNSCQARFRNIPVEDWEKDPRKPPLTTGNFNLWIKYKNKRVTVQFFDRDAERMVTCVDIDQELDYNGAWVFTAGSGTNSDADYIYINDATMYDMSHESTLQEQQEYH